MKLKHTNYSATKFPLARHVRRATWKGLLNLIALRKHDKATFSELWKKIHFYLTCCRYAICMNRQSEFFSFYRAVLPHLSDSRRNQKILGPNIHPPNFQALISPSPEIFPWRINVRISKCLWLVYSSYHPLNFTFSHPDSLDCAASIVRVRYYTNNFVLNTLWNSYLNQATKNVYRYLYFPNFPIPKEIPWWKISNKKEIPLSSR